ncbi:DsbA family protein [Nocardioides sp. MAHUQ-72]|uniref:DsbA family protein n=1 Tax=unclassified Nocardioides TaxID=2615069 RepID=UPI00361239B2
MSKKTARDSRAERAAAALKEQQRAERRRATLMIGGVVVAILLVVVGGFLVNRARDTSTDVSAPPAGTGDYGVAIGQKDAPHTVVIYEDFLCPYCGELEKVSHDELASLADEGKVYVEYRPFNLLDTDYSVAAAAAFKVVLDESGPDVAKKFHDLLYADQPEESGPYPDSSWLVDKAVEAGATESDVRDGIESGAGKSWVEDASKAADAAGVRGTPTILLDGKVFTDGRTVDQLSQNLVDQLG